MSEEPNTENESTPTEAAAEQAEGGIVEGNLRKVKIEDLDFEDQSLMFRTGLRIGPLAKSLAEQGLQIPVVLRGRTPGRNQKFQIISGFRRCNAAKELGWTEITALVRPSDMSDEEAFKASVLENTERKTYSDIDRAYVIQAYRSRGLGSMDISNLMGLSKRQTNNILGLLELPASVQAAIDDPNQHFSATHGLTLKKLGRKYKNLEFDGWVRKTNEQELSVARLARQVNQEYRHELPTGFSSIFNPAATKLDSGEVRLMPIKFTVGELSEEEKVALKSELQHLISLL